MKLSDYLTLSSQEAGPKEPDPKDDFGVNIPGDEDRGDPEPPPVG